MEENEMEQENRWANSLIGRTFDTQKALSGGWYHQGAKNFHYGFPQKKNLWLKKMNPAEKCCHTVWIFLLVELKKDQSIRKATTQIHHVFLDGRGEVLDVDLFPPDRDRAVKEIETVLNEDA